MLEDLLKSTQQHFFTRLTNPLSGAFLVAWGIWNYKFIVILFSDASISHTFYLIQLISFPNKMSIAIDGLLIPLISALGYVFLYPYPALVVFEFTQRQQRKINQIRKEIDDETPLTIEESRLIREQYRTLEQEYKSNIDKLNDEISDLKLRPNNEKNNSTQRANTSVVSSMVESQLRILKTIEAVDGKASLKELASNSGTTKTRLEFDIGELIRHDLIQVEFDDYGRQQYVFTHAGRKALLTGEY